MRPREDDALLRDMLEHARRAINAASDRSRSDLEHDPVLVAALERFVEVVGEAASRLSEATREESPSIPWREVIAMRNRLVHGYFAVDHDILWTVVNDELPALTGSLQEMIDVREDA
jgi:uncharacterized protein with HEPN domain